MDIKHVVGDVDDESLKSELEACKHFLVDSEFENGRHKVFNFALNVLDAHRMNEKLDTVFNSLKCAAKINMAFGFFEKSGRCKLSVLYCS